MQKQNQLSIYKDMHNFAPPPQKKSIKLFAKVFLFPNRNIQLKR